MRRTSDIAARAARWARAVPLPGGARRPRGVGLRLGAAVFVAGLAAADSVGAQTFSGTGQQATNFFEWPAGLAVIELSHVGDGPFRVRLVDARGRPVELLADTLGAGRLTRAVRMRAGDAFLFDVDANGDWEIRVRDGAGGFAAADMAALGRVDGQRAARRAGGARWMGFGLAGGLVLGPIGGGAVFALAGSRPPGEPTRPPDDAAALGAAYHDAFRAEYRRAVRSERRTAAVVGGVIGTVANAVILLNFAGGRGGDDSDGIPRPPELNRLPPAFVGVAVPWPARP